MDELKERYHFRIYGDNVTKFKACQEFSMVGEDMKNVIYLYIGVGVACVQFFDGKVIEGKTAPEARLATYVWTPVEKSVIAEIVGV